MGKITHLKKALETEAGSSQRRNLLTAPSNAGTGGLSADPGNQPIDNEAIEHHDVLIYLKFSN